MEVNNESELSTQRSMSRGDTHCIWWKLRTRLEKLLFCFWIIAIIFLFGLLIAIIILLSLPNFTKNTSVCTTTACLNAASDIMRYIDQTISPCDDFYQFACGNWLKSVVIPDDSLMISSFSQTQDKIDLKLKNIIEMPLNEKDSQTIINMKNMYNSCVNLTVIRTYGSDPLLKYLQLFGGWPVLEGNNWNKSNFDWIEMIAKMRNLGFRHQFFFHIRVAPNLKHNTVHNIYLTESTFSSLSKNELKYGLESVKVKQYLNLMVDIAVLLGGERDKAEIELKNVVILESLIANSPQHDNRFKPLTIEELEEMAPNTDWIKLINNVVSLNYTINEKETIFIQSDKAVKLMDKLFSSYQLQNQRVLANYIIWKIISQSFLALDNRFIKLEDKFFSVIRPQRRSSERWKLCLKQITATFRAGVTHLYLTHQKSREKTKYLVNQIFTDIQSVLIKKFDEIFWIDEETRSNAKFKAKFINRFIGYSDELLNETKIDEIYEGLEKLDKDTFFMNVLRLRKWTFDSEYSKLRKFNDRNNWQQVLTSAAVNAYYSPFINSIKIPIWILEGIFFDFERPKYLNYGALGWVIGHEMIHPFDNVGGRFDKRGNLRDWWDIESKQLFDSKSQCMVKQYGKYNLSYELNINGKTTLSENIADNGGLNNALRAYNEFVERNGEELPLAGLQYSVQQLFWIRAANIWCSKHTPEGYKNTVKNSIHSLSEYRVFVPFSNSKEFSEAFQCREGDRMNPKHKCKVW